MKKHVKNAGTRNHGRFHPLPLTPLRAGSLGRQKDDSNLRDDGIQRIPAGGGYRVVRRMRLDE